MPSVEWKVEQVGDLARRVLEQIAEDDHRAVAGIEGCERRQHAVVPLDRDGGRDVLLLDLGANLCGARPVYRPVDRDPVQPWTERPAAVEAIERADCREEGFLRDVLRAAASCTTTNAAR